MKTNGMVIWLTGLSGAGKTTIAQTLERLFLTWQLNVELLDGDVIRTNLSKGLGYTKDDRDTNIRRVGFVANLLSRNGVIVIVATISPHRLVRDEMKAMIPNFLEVYVNAPLNVCESRDVKGLYAAARRGKIKEFTGIDAPYEAPFNPDINCFTDQETVEESVAKIMQALKSASFWHDMQPETPTEIPTVQHQTALNRLPTRRQKA
ncbi:MAG: adenylyl-sulfate kinase [Tildeniella nuda ZEHNDER 1965/U140]|jgi:adenylylsulfate kinase|nr:adenylyl-sulfate kinase [Tildeniella nuda ZEHNDER 1965/U140]